VEKKARKEKNKMVKGRNKVGHVMQPIKIAWRTRRIVKVIGCIYWIGLLALQPQ
jgi:hypothetical protein